MRLSDTHLILLAGAAKRNDGIITLPDRLKGSEAQKVVGGLLKAKHVEEIAATGRIQAWRRNAEGSALGLRITDAGLQAIGAGGPHSARTASKRTAKAGAKRKAKARSGARAASAKALGGRDAKEESKQDTVLAMLRSKSGVTVAALMKATDWQAHSVRGFLSGVLKKRLKLNVTSAKDGEERVYRIASEAPARRARANAK